VKPLDILCNKCGAVRGTFAKGLALSKFWFRQQQLKCGYPARPPHEEAMLMYFRVHGPWQYEPWQASRCKLHACAIPKCVECLGSVYIGHSLRSAMVEKYAKEFVCYEDECNKQAAVGF
jgi:hypothetical protein